MKILILLIALIFVTGCPSTQQSSPPRDGGILPVPVAVPTYKVYVKGLVCPSCAVGLKKGLMKLSIIELIHVNYKTGLVLIYNPTFEEWVKGGMKLPTNRVWLGGSPWFNEATGKQRAPTEVYKMIYSKKNSDDKLRITKAVKDSGYEVDRFVK